VNRSLYLAGAMSCYFNMEQNNYPKQWREEVKVCIQNYYNDITVISPTDFYEIGKDCYKSESEPMRFDLRMVRESDIILVNLKDLHKSLGTSDEIFYAFIKGKPIIGFLEDETEYENIHPWKLEQIDRIETGQDAMINALNYIYRHYVDR